MTILCPIDFSAVTQELVSCAAALAAGAGAELRLLHVLEPGAPVAAPRPGLGVARQLVRCRQAARRAGACVSAAVAQGDAVGEIVAAARRHPADIIVIGAHGQTGLTRFLMGSTAESVLRTAPCLTLLVKPGCPRVKQA
ncbi:universal stress protein [Hymenobacter rubripertinctus]|uniref:Universal stress protein n=1 Tax=Hymenobacter rubripertinctus TaxID=2029981 RepID=A0A418QRZ3_9BACT|nr:universal stress protein [Hymenobacter rubripertinctus]RIY07790.1 universal stress protein [Hymenobacter rubripertinctus]